ncbi:tetratricopeptide repeat protein [Rhodocyclus purpureus]|uniref:tetratricopeptide repeat protein n=1 Tax=Rhodocyclus purpureus TaxID=1067 RepID=UPI001914A319|nr:tetratricopeptide repeat protein [Rhodocyclus purpureus]MBK5914866.1 pilus assembly protein TadD [Rhodocyclus purpureus]
MSRSPCRLLAATLPAALLLALAAPAAAADQAPAPAAEPVPLAAQAALPAVPAVAPAGTPSSRLPELRARGKKPVMPAAEAGEASASARLVFQVLLAEIALQRGDVALAAQAWTDLAQRSRDPQVLERAIEVAGYARRLDLALESARLWLEIEPSSSRAQQMLAGVLIVGEKYDELAPLLTRMLAADPEGLPGNLVGLNRMLLRAADRGAAWQLVEQVTEPFLGLPEAHYARAVAANSAAMPTRALDEAQRALEQRPDWELAALLRAQVLARSSTAAAVASLERFVADNPGAREVRLHLARALIAENRYADARSHFELLVADSPDNTEVLFPAAILALQLNDSARAETLLLRLLDLEFADKSVARYYLGQIAEQRQQLDAALAFYRAVGPGEQYLPAQLRSARLLAERGQDEDALRQLRTVKARSAEERAQLALVQAQILRDARKWQEAFVLLSDELSRQPSEPDLLYETALLAEKLGRIDLLEKHLRRLIELRPDSPTAYNALGYSLADRKLRLSEARELIAKALSLAPEDPFIIDSLGWVLYRQGDLAAARVQLERAFALRADPEIAAHLGEVLWMLGSREEATRLWRDAQARSPDNEALADVLKRFAP